MEYLYAFIAGAGIVIDAAVIVVCLIYALVLVYGD
jgi:hypothetical protein